MRLYGEEIPLLHPSRRISGDVTEGYRAQKNHGKRNPFPGVSFFKVPLRLYDGGYAARMSASEIARYVTLLRVSNFNYGKEILISAGSLERLDGIAPRTARHVYTKLRELGLLRRSETNRHGHVLIHPWQWPDLDTAKPRLRRLVSGRLICAMEPSNRENPPQQENRWSCNPWQANQIPKAD